MVWIIILVLYDIKQNKILLLNNNNLTYFLIQLFLFVLHIIQTKKSTNLHGWYFFVHALTGKEKAERVTCVPLFCSRVARIVYNKADLHKQRTERWSRMSLINLAQIKDGVSLAERVAALEQLAAKLDAKVFPPPRAEHVVGMVLAEEGNRVGTWVRVNQDFETVEFDNVLHNTWNGMHTVMNDTYGEFVKIPITYVKTETLTDGPYTGKNCWWTADYAADGFHVHPAFIGQDGQPHPLQIASWIASNKNDVPFSEDKGNSNSGYWNNISYDTVHNKGWMTGGCRPYNIYDHHFLARLMLTEFGTPDVQAQTVDGVAWTGENRISYHGIYDPFGTSEAAEYYWLDGLTTLNGTYQVLAANGSRNMIETGVSCQSAGVWPTNCRVDQANGIDFGDLFIANSSNNFENLGSFADYQNLSSGYAFNVNWNPSSYRGAFCLSFNTPTRKGTVLGWRVAICS